MGSPATKAARRAAAPIATETNPVAAAEAARNALLDRIAAGDRVEPGELVDADAAVRLAELRSEVAAKAGAEAAEAQRLARVDDLRRSINDGTIRAKADRVLELHAQAVSVLTEMLRTANEHHEAVRLTLRELHALGDPLPGVELLWGVHGGVRSQLRGAVIDGVTWRPAKPEESTRLVADAAATAVERAGGYRPTLTALRAAAGTRHLPSPSEALRRRLEEHDTQAGRAANEPNEPNETKEIA